MTRTPNHRYYTKTTEQQLGMEATVAGSLASRYKPLVIDVDNLNDFLNASAQKMAMMSLRTVSTETQIVERLAMLIRSFAGLMEIIPDHPKDGLSLDVDTLERELAGIILNALLVRGIVGVAEGESTLDWVNKIQLRMDGMMQACHEAAITDIKTLQESLLIHVFKI